ncbi:MAG TPA: DUF364 domain-containing protein [Thermodesulfobacteriota bacterium]|nr:DUF364 domain-containing protein [Thermodesulfobacteriota bacterium]
MYEQLKNEFRTIVDKHNLSAEEIMVTAQTLSPEEAIGNPEEDDYPILKGRERIVEAQFRGARGHAFTDMFGNWRGTIKEILGMEMKNNFRRSVFVSTLNAVLRHLRVVEGTVHCKDHAPQECSKILVEKIRSEFGNPKILLVGFQPRMAEALAQGFPLRITDLDEANIGTKRFGVVIQSPQETQESIAWCDLMVVTGSTAVNNTMKEFIGRKPVIFYGVTVAGPAYLLGLNRFCPFGS